MKNLITKRGARIAAAALAATVTFGAMAFALSYKPAADSYTIASEDGGYYSETTYYLTEEAFGEYESGKQTGKPAAKAMSASSESTSESEQEGGEFVMGVAKSVWVMEELDEDGNVVDSQLLTKDEMDDYGISTMSVSNKFTQDNLFGGGGGGGGYSDEEIGSESATLHRLTIDAVVTYNEKAEKYSVTGNASWKAEFALFQDLKTAEHRYLDYFAISWGGEGALQATSHSFTGKYHADNDGIENDVSYAKAFSDYKIGYVWEFSEKSSTWGKELKLATIKATIERTKPLEDLTSIRVTYIHTYDELSGTLTVGASTADGFEAAVGISTTKGNWSAILEFDRIS